MFTINSNSILARQHVVENERERESVIRKCEKQRLLYLRKGKRAKEERKGSFPSFHAIIVKVNENDGKYENALLLHDFSIIFSLSPPSYICIYAYYRCVVRVNMEK